MGGQLSGRFTDCPAATSGKRYHSGASTSLASGILNFA
jgi:hypothetical protein